ncbi:MAG: peptidoglycan DD-metalloendopeptidase family protein [Rhodocyclaceae bacterium]|nr:peptidoglycan DD-metalloendopeptidase family protein [Rhodocyclaceae bacterium]MDZ4215001.1 peptidoglycan DD-metalloendopeptidase family protein [Rhodocyclaceae bacterium]
MPTILNQRKLALTHNHKKPWLLSLAAIVMITGGALAFGTAPDTVTYSGQRYSVTEPLSDTLPIQIANTETINARELRIQAGDTVAELLERSGVSGKDVLPFLRSNQEAASIFRQLAPGKVVSSQVGADGTLLALSFPLNGSDNAYLNVRNTANGFTVNTLEADYESRVIHQSAVIRHSLFGATDSAGIPDSVALQVAEIFSGVIDFHRDLRKNDHLSVIYELKTRQGKPEKLARILAAKFVNDGKPHHAFWFKVTGGTEGYYDLNGSSLKKAFLRSPLEFSRITSGFSSGRFHPVLREMRAHRGIDYGAPTGTRVRVTGDGVVEFAGVRGGYGNVVTVRHPGGKTTVYGHLSKFAQGMKKGARVQQGDIIGYVGATGLATGPHLHYEFQINGVHLNPQTVALPPATPLPTTRLAEFRRQATDHLETLEMLGVSPLTMLD